MSPSARLALRSTSWQLASSACQLMAAEEHAVFAESLRRPLCICTFHAQLTYPRACLQDASRQQHMQDSSTQAAGMACMAARHRSDVTASYAHISRRQLHFSGAGGAQCANSCQAHLYSIDSSCAQPTQGRVTQLSPQQWKAPCVVAELAPSPTLPVSPPAQRSQPSACASGGQEAAEPFAPCRTELRVPDAPA